MDVRMSDALARVIQRGEDVAHAYQSGFEPRGVGANGAARVEPSEDPLSAAAPEGTYFVFGDEKGAVRYSRNGAFSIRDGILRSEGGLRVLGFTSHGAGLEPMGVDPVDMSLGRVQNARIERDGNISYTRGLIDPRTGQRLSERVSLGRIALARFPAGTLPVRLDLTHVQAPSGVTPHVGAPADGNFAMLITNARDVGRLDVLAGLSRLQEAYVSLEALKSARNADDSVVKTAMDLHK
jgi:flagellar basal body rod protein FlgG